MATRVFIVCIHVSSMQRMVSFYRDVLGFETDWNGTDTWVKFRNQGVIFCMYARSELERHIGALSYPTGLNGTFGLAIDLPVFADVDALFSRAVEAGATPVSKPGGPNEGDLAMRAAWIADPEGNLIEISSWNGKYEEDESASETE